MTPHVVFNFSLPVINNQYIFDTLGAEWHQRPSRSPTTTWAGSSQRLYAQLIAPRATKFIAQLAVNDCSYWLIYIGWIFSELKTGSLNAAQLKWQHFSEVFILTLTCIGIIFIFDHTRSEENQNYMVIYGFLKWKNVIFLFLTH